MILIEIQHFRPSVGTVAETKFQIQCDNWECPDLPIKYEFTTKTKLGEGQGVSVSTLSRTDYPIWYSGYEPRNPKSILPLGDPDNGYNLTLIVRIFNAYGSFTELDPIIATVSKSTECCGHMSCSGLLHGTSVLDRSIGICLHFDDFLKTSTLFPLSNAA